MNNSTAFTGSNSERFSPVVYSGFLGAIAFPIVLGNLFIIVTYSKRKHSSNHAHILLVNLAVADILVGAISIPIYIYLIGSQSNWWATYPRVVYFIYDANDILAGLASIFSLVCIALERLYAIMLPLKHRLATKRLYYGCLIMIWLTSALIVILRFILDFRTLAYIVTITFGSSLFLIFIAYIALWCTVKTHKLSTNQRQIEATRERKLAKTLSLVTVVFILTWVPFHVIIAIFYYFCAPKCYRLPLVVFYTSKFLHYANSIANPILYAFRMKEFRDSFRLMLHYYKRNKTKAPVTNQTGVCKKGEDNTAFEMDTKL